MSKTIIGIQLKNRVSDAPDFQSLLSKYGTIIQTRIGLHDASCHTNPQSGIILLDFTDCADAELDQFRNELSNFSGVNMQQMTF